MTDVFSHCIVNTLELHLFTFGILPIKTYTEFNLCEITLLFGGRYWARTVFSPSVLQWNPDPNEILENSHWQLQDKILFFVSKWFFVLCIKIALAAATTDNVEIYNHPKLQLFKTFLCNEHLFHFICGTEISET